MKIEAGQDALGRWAWIMRDTDGTMVASNDGYADAATAIESALRCYDTLQREDRRARRYAR